MRMKHPSHLIRLMQIENFQFLTPLWLYRGSDAAETAPEGQDALYVVGADYSVSFDVPGAMKGGQRIITVPKGLLTDLASVPRVARSFAGRVGRHLEASIVHDWLYGAHVGSREFADQVFLAGMKAAKVPRLQRWLIYRAVRTFGARSYRKGTNQFVEIP